MTGTTGSPDCAPTWDKGDAKVKVEFTTITGEQVLGHAMLGFMLVKLFGH